MHVSMWTVSVVYNLLHIPHIFLWNLTLSACPTKVTPFPFKCSFIYIRRSSCLHQHYHHIPECLGEILQASANAFRLLLSCFLDNCFLLLTHLKCSEASVTSTALFSRLVFVIPDFPPIAIWWRLESSCRGAHCLCYLPYSLPSPWGTRI